MSRVCQEDSLIAPCLHRCSAAHCLQKALPLALARLLFPGRDCEVPRVASLRGEGGAVPAGHLGSHSSLGEPGAVSPIRPLATGLAWRKD